MSTTTTNSDVWSKLKYFTRDEFGKDADKLKPELLLALDLLRLKLDTPIKITSAYRSSDGGWHGKGAAVDFVLPAWNKTAYEAYVIIQSVTALQGIGLYPNWTLNGKRIIGFHVDVRQKSGRWIGTGHGKSDAAYEVFSDVNLIKYGLKKV